MANEILNFDYQIFQFFNSSAGQNEILDAIFVILAEWVMFGLIAGLALFILAKKSDRERPKVALQALIAAFIARGLIAPLLRILFWRARPFVAFQVTQLISHDPLEGAFPSGHTTVMASLAFFLLLRYPKWGIPYLILTFVSGFSRVIVGVHFPLDIIGGIALGALSSLVVSQFNRLVKK